MKVVLFMVQLRSGGAQRQIINLAAGISSRVHEVNLVTVFPGGEFCELVNESRNLTHSSIWKERGKSRLTRLFQLILTPFILRVRITKIDPDVVYSFLELTNLIAWVATRFGFSEKLIWGLRSGKRDMDWKQSFPEKLSIFISKTVPLVISNSEAGNYYYSQKGYRPKNIISIANGVDIDYFKPDNELGILFRNQYGINTNVYVVGAVGRINPIKDLPVFFQAAEIVSEILEEVFFVVAGMGEAPYVDKLIQQVHKSKIESKVIWIGYQDNMVGIYNLFDLMVSSSIVEGSPNVVMEAMACGTPCIVTDVGDSASIVDDPACVVTPGDSKALANAIADFITNDRPHDYYRKARKRIVDNYSIDLMVHRTINAFIKYLPHLSDWRK